ncbi:MAG: UDP-N-acetylmuramate dehydrogenase [Christensenellales bacterium]|jgi:UDP-N-acetylmuramate dehydrogenase
MNINEISKKLSEKIDDVRIKENMASHTSFKVGGCADVMAIPKSQSEIKHAVVTTAALRCPIFVMGRGTNLIVTSKGFRGVILKLADHYSGVEFDGEYATVKSGTPLGIFVRDAINRSLGGVEFLGGIPGTVGGAVYMNAGAYGGEIGDLVEQVYLVSRAGDLTLSRDEMGFGYRRSILNTMPLVITGLRLRLKKCHAEQCRQKLAELSEQRRQKQPLEYPSAGSTFKRPQGYYAGALIEQAGLKGLRIGGAEVSEKHAGFIVNKGGATPEDILALIEEVRLRVMENSGVMLEPEVKVIGEK